MNSMKVRLRAWVKQILRPIARPMKRWAKPIVFRFRTGFRAVRAHHQVGHLLPILERSIETLRQEREQSDQLLLALYQTLHYPPTSIQRKPTARFVVPLGNQRLLVAHDYAPFLFLDANDLRDTPSIVLNRYQPGVSAALAGILKPGQYVIDLAAGPGYHTLTMASVVGKTGRVDAFLQDPAEKQWLDMNLLATAATKFARSWCGFEIAEAIEEAKRYPDCIHIGSRCDPLLILPKLKELLAEKPVPILFHWVADCPTNPIAESLHNAGLMFWTIEPDGSLYRTGWEEMQSRSGNHDAAYLAARSLS